MRIWGRHNQVGQCSDVRNREDNSLPHQRRIPGSRVARMGFGDLGTMSGINSTVIGEAVWAEYEGEGESRGTT